MSEGNKGQSLTYSTYSSHPTNVVGETNNEFSRNQKARDYYKEGKKKLK